MKNTIHSLYTLYRKQCVPFYLTRLAFSVSAPRQKALLLASWCLLLVSFLPLVWLGYASPSTLTQVYSLVFPLGIFVGLFLHEKYCQLAFKKQYPRYAKEIEFTKKDNRFMHCLLLREALLQERCYTPHFLHFALKNIELTLESPTFHPTTLPLVCSIPALGVLWALTQHTPAVSFSMLLVLPSMVYCFCFLLLHRKSPTRKLYALKGCIKRMLLELEREGQSVE